MFNLQSGIRRQRFPNPVTPAQARRIEAQKAQNPDVDASKGLKSLGKGVGKHTSAVTGIEVDNLNRTVVSCSLDGKVKVCFSTRAAPLPSFWVKTTLT